MRYEFRTSHVRHANETTDVIERPSASDFLRGGGALFVILLFVAALAIAQGQFPAARDNIRVDRLERLGYEASIATRAKPAGNNDLVFNAARGRPAHGEWYLDSYEMDHELAAASSCDIALYVIGPNARGLSTHAAIDVSLDGTLVRHLAFGPHAIDFVAESRQRSPVGIAPAEIYLTPINREFGLRFETGSRFCHTVKHWRVDLAMHDVDWDVHSVGAIVRFAPPRLDPGHALIPIFLAGCVLIAMFLVFHVLLALVHRNYGLAGIAVVTLIACVATITHDEWDYAVWLRFIDLVAFGGGDPAYMWAGSPLWPFIPSTLFSPVLVAFYALTGNASDEIPSLCLKLLMTLAVVSNAYLISREAPVAFRRFIFFTTLLAPVGLYELTGGYREVFAASFALSGLALTMRSRYILAAVIMALGTSISESLAPLIFFPMAVAFADRRAGRTSILRGAASGGTALAVLAVEWFVLIPHTFATNAIVTRVQAYRYGGASLFAVLDHYGLLPDWVGTHSLALVAALFIVLGSPIAILATRAIVRTRRLEDATRAVLSRYFAALIVALFLAYRGIDPNDWYPLFAVVAYYFARFEPRNPYPLLIGVISGFAFYSIVGISDFVNWSYFSPLDRSLLGALGSSTFVMIAVVNLVLLAFYVSVVSRNTRLLFGRGTPFYGALFVASAATAASNYFPADAAFCAAAGTAIAIAFYRNFRIFDPGLATSDPLPLRFVGLTVALLTAVLATNVGGGGASATIVMFTAVAWGARKGFGLCDVALVAGSIWLCCDPNRFGWVSIAGWVGLSILTLRALVPLALTRRSIPSPWIPKH